MIIVLREEELRLADRISLRGKKKEGRKNQSVRYVGKIKCALIRSAVVADSKIMYQLALTG